MVDHGTKTTFFFFFEMHCEDNTRIFIGLERNSWTLEFLESYVPLSSCEQQANAFRKMDRV
jgi:hypothetical protein